MANVTLRLVKGSPLTNSEVDNNFSNLNIFKTEIGGDLGGNVFYPTVIGLRGRSVSNTEPENSQVLSWSANSNVWIAANAVASYGELTTKPAVNVSITGDLTGSSNVVLTNTNTNNLSINVSYDYDNLDSRFLKLHNPTTQIVTSYIEFQGNVIFAGNVATIAANNLLIEDNFIYLNANNFSSNEDLGLAGNYNDGIYAHTGIFRDASDNGTWKIFEGYLPEVSAAINIDTDNASFRLANLAINALTANTIQGIVSTAVVTNLNADLLDGQQGVYYTNYANQTNRPAANIIVSGDVLGTANAVLTANTTVLSVNVTIQPTSVVASTYGNATIVPVITIGADGRITSASNVNISGVSGGGSSDTLANVTARGNVTTDTITLSNTGNSLIASGTITSNILISRVNPRFFSEVSNANLIVNISLFDQYNLTALATNLTINSSTLGNPENGNKIVLRLKDDGNVRNITWSSTTPGGFRGVGVTLPANTSPVANVFYIGCIYNSEDTLWDVIAVSK
jgi:hypothetical protein